MTEIACKYFVQNEPCDTESGYSNLFVLSRKCGPGERVRFKDVAAEFPLNGADGACYHLRFQTFLPEAPESPVWVDILNEEAFVPLVKPGVVFIKALRLPPGLKQKLKQNKPMSASPDLSTPKPVKKEITKNTDSDEEFDLGSCGNTPNKEEKKEPKVTEVNSVKSEMLDFDFGVSPDSRQPDIAPVLQPSAYKEPVKAQSTAPKEEVRDSNTSLKPPQAAPARPSSAAQAESAPKGKDIVHERVQAAVTFAARNRLKTSASSGSRRTKTMKSATRPTSCTRRKSR